MCDQEIDDVLERAAQPDGYLYTYEVLSDTDPESPRAGESGGHRSWRECFMASVSEVTPSASSHPSSDGARGRPTPEQIAARRQEIEDTRRNLEPEEAELNAAQEPPPPHVYVRVTS